MLALALAIEFTADLDAAVPRLEAALDAELSSFMTAAAASVAFVAAREHGYTRRTGRAESETQGVPASGQFSRDTLQSAAAIATEYGEFLEGRRDLAALEPAWRQLEPRLEHELDVALDRAAATAGWR